MKRIQIILLGLVLLLAACTSAVTEPTTSEPSQPSSEPKPMDEIETVPEVAPLPETADNEQAVKPQFIMFTASW